MILLERAGAGCFIIWQIKPRLKVNNPSPEPLPMIEHMVMFRESHSLSQTRPLQGWTKQRRPFGPRGSTDTLACRGFPRSRVGGTLAS